MLKGDVFDEKFQRCQEMFDRWNKAKKKIYSDGSLDDDSSMKDERNGGDFVDVVEVPSGKWILKGKGTL